ncbi:hypothetical protein KC340_g1431 [Hortaea werneckii]|nr:hypothetical protein KC342_g1119 [Hortaea werneckii]KAI7107108.1 hypothetical protein KC339_g2655 [Hortaea werneckii]KAI7243601.1 hypothetical protein KC365_g2137 [Hortaea werneckii]KAI7336981.1 hypothetical protein KC340_g1431 [Hortaea werneckii]KAI7388228.1 hypothetical protein KC328_g9041 [Hortaea werneckii]
MEKVTEQEVAEHRDVLKGLDAQIARLTRREDELFKKMERGQSRDEAHEVFDGLTKIKEQRQRVEKERQEEAAAFEHLLSQNRLAVLPGTRSANKGKRQDGPLQPFSTDVMDLSFDEDDEEPVKRETFPPTERNVAKSTTASGGRQLQRIRKKAQLPGEGLVPMPKADSPTTYGARNYPPVAKTHPTLITNPTADGAVELRCPYCKTNLHKSGTRLLDGVNGFSLHLNSTHKVLRPPGDRFSHKQTFELCSYRTVPQDVVDAIQGGDLRAYVVKKMYPKVGP